MAGMDMNYVFEIGNLTRDEELKYTPGGMAVGSFSIAVNRRVKKGQDWVDEVNYFDVSIFGKQAEGLKKFLTKGKQVGIVGYVKQDRWTDLNGQKRSTVKIVANELQLLGGKDNGNQSSGGYENAGFDDGGYNF